MNNLKIVIIYIIGAFFYYLSLTKINGMNMECLKRENIKCFFTLALFTFSSSIIIFVVILIIIVFKKDKYHIFIIIIIYLYLFNKDHDAVLINHGIYNIILFILSFFISFLFFTFIILMKYLYSKIKCHILTIFIIIFLSIFLIFKNYKSNHFSCKNWSKGFNNTYIDNKFKDYPCIIKMPELHSCYLSEISPLLDLTPKYRPNCENKKLSDSQTKHFYQSVNKIKYFNLSEKIYFGYPITSNEKFKNSDFGNICYPGKKNFENEIHKKIILMDLYNKNITKYYPNEPRPEIYINFKNKTGNISIEVQKNNTLIKERENISRKNIKKQMFKNIIVFFFDTVSRSHFFRKFPKTIKFLNQFSGYETNYNKKKLSLFQFFKYSSLNTFTYPNLKASYYGAKNKGKGIHFANYFKKNGYIIGKISTFCAKLSVVGHKKLNYAIWDHEGTQLSCIKAIYHGIFVGRLNSIIKKCIFGKEVFQYALEYLESFWKTYFNYNKMFLFESLEGHEWTGELIGHLDDIVYNFFNKIYKNDWLKNTTIIIFSDHGQHFNYLINSQDFLIERSLPLLIFVIPNHEDLYKDKLYEKISSNQQIFVTPFDIYNTLIHIAFENKKEEIKKYFSIYGSSLITKLNYKVRFCKSPFFKFRIAKCNCLKN